MRPHSNAPTFYGCRASYSVFNAPTPILSSERITMFLLSPVSHAEDQTAHLLWRMQHQEVFTLHQPQVAVVLIGTNDLGAAASCPVEEPGALAAVNGTAAR